MGGHCIKSWSTTQSIVSLSSGEAEFYGIVKGASIGLGVQGIMKDIGIDQDIEVYTDASAARGIALRKGLGKVRHLETNQLWIQDRVRRGDIKITKVSGDINIADALTKYVPKDAMLWHMNQVSQEITKGRHSIAPDVEEREEGDMMQEDEEEESE